MQGPESFQRPQQESSSDSSFPIESPLSMSGQLVAITERELKEFDVRFVRGEADPVVEKAAERDAAVIKELRRHPFS